MSHIEAFQSYLALEKKYSPHTVLAYLKDIERFQEFCRKEQLGAVDDAVYSCIRSWVVNLSDSGLTSRSINRKMASLKSYYKFLMKIGVISVSPLIKHKSLKAGKKVQVPFSTAEMEEVINSFEHEQDFETLRDRLIVELLYETGMRKSELINLKLDDFSISRLELRVLGKRNKERILPIRKKLIRSYTLYIEERAKLPVVSDSEYVFLTKKGSKVYGALVYRVINLYFSKASSKLKKSPHVIRHSFATHLLNEGADLNSVKELLGHTSLAATQVYTHTSLSKLQEVYQSSHPRNQNN